MVVFNVVVGFIDYSGASDLSSIRNQQDVPVGWVNFQLFDHLGVLRSGQYSMRMWPDERATPISSVTELIGFSMFIARLTYASPCSYVR